MAKNSTQTAKRFSGYVVQRRLGSGAGSSIFEVLDPTTGQSYALKRICKRTDNDLRFFRQAENEYAIGQQVDHPSVRKFHKLNRLRSLFKVREMHLLMEMVYGQTLESRRPTNPLTVVRVFKRIISGLGAMHQAGFAHADIKPNNVLVGTDGVVKIIDLGQSCPIGTIKQRIQGTPDYIAPEQVHRHPIDQRTDVFNVGATLYWVLTEKHVPTVLPKSQPGREIALVGSHHAEPPDAVNPRVPVALSRLTMDCVKLNPTDRPAGMGVLADRLDTVELMMVREARNRQDADAPIDSSDSSEWVVPDPDEPEKETVDLPGFEVN